jgi:hypothetical protein
MASHEVDDNDCLRVRYIDEGPTAFGIQLKAFGMNLQGNIRDLGAPFGLNNRERAAALSDDNAVGNSVEPNDIGVCVQIDAARFRMVRSAKHMHRTIAGICDIQHVG